MKSSKMFFALSLVSISVCTASNVIAQSYKSNHVIKLGSGETLQALQCREIFGEQECELQHFRNKQQVGKNFWLSAKSIARLGMQSKPDAPASGSNQTQNLAVRKTVPAQQPALNHKAIAKNESALSPAEQIAMARAAIEQADPTAFEPKKEIVVQPKKEVTIKPAREKKEFVSHNPFLLKEYKAGGATAKQE